MSVFRRGSTPCLALALLAYLVMSGIDDVHIHEQIVRSAITRYTTMIAVIANQITCPICAWHAMTFASCQIDFALLMILHVVILLDGVTRRLIHIQTSIVRSRAPPQQIGIPILRYSLVSVC